MIIGKTPYQMNGVTASFYGFRKVRTSQFYGPKGGSLVYGQKTYNCAEQSDNCMECLSCCDAQFSGKPIRRLACKRRCTRKFPASTCQPGVIPKDTPPPGAEMCPQVCVPDGTGVTCNYNCMGVTTNIINTGIPGEVIPVNKVVTWFQRDSWMNWFAAGTPTGSGSYYAPTAAGGTGILDTITGGTGPSLTTVALLGGGGYLLYKFFTKGK